MFNTAHQYQQSTQSYSQFTVRYIDQTYADINNSVRGSDSANLKLSICFAIFHAIYVLLLRIGSNVNNALNFKQFFSDLIY